MAVASSSFQLTRGFASRCTHTWGCGETLPQAIIAAERERQLTYWLIAVAFDTKNDQQAPKRELLPDIGKFRKAEADLRAEQLRPIIEPLRSLPARRISAILNDRKIAAPQGGGWQATQAIRLLNRLDLVPA